MLAFPVSGRKEADVRDGSKAEVRAQADNVRSTPQNRTSETRTVMSALGQRPT